MNKLRNLAIGVTALSAVASLGAAMAWGTLTTAEQPTEAIPAQLIKADEVVKSGAGQFGQQGSVTLGGTQTPVRGHTVGEALKNAGITPGPADIVSAPLDAKLVNGQRISFVKVTSKQITKKAAIPFDKVTEKSSSLSKGEKQVSTKGVNGEAVETYRQTFHDGKLVSTELVSTQLIRMPVAEVTQVGTASSSAGATSPRSSSSRSSDRSESPVTGGNTCKASYYWEGQMTANGERFNPNDLTAAHKSLPFGSRVKVTNTSNGRTVVVRINDRGPYVAGRCLDLSKAAMSQIGGTGAGVVTVRYQVL